jgi:hypothetical protein
MLPFRIGCFVRCFDMLHALLFNNFLSLNGGKKDFARLLRARETRMFQQLLHCDARTEHTKPGSHETFFIIVKLRVQSVCCLLINAIFNQSSRLSCFRFFFLSEARGPLLVCAACSRWSFGRQKLFVIQREVGELQLKHNQLAFRIHLFLRCLRLLVFFAST